MVIVFTINFMIEFDIKIFVYHATELIDMLVFQWLDFDHK